MSEPRTRPEQLPGYMQHANTPDGTLYVFLGWDDVGLREVFATVGRGGGTIHGFAEGLGRMISLLLQYSVPVPEIVRMLKGIRSAHAGEGGEGAYLSIPDAVARIMEEAPEHWPEREVADVAAADAAYDRGFVAGRQAGVVAALETASGLKPPEHCDAEQWETSRKAAEDLLARIREGSIKSAPERAPVADEVPAKSAHYYADGVAAGRALGYQAGLEAALQALCRPDMVITASTSELTAQLALDAARSAVLKLREKTR